jgi:hypothetical protein
MNAVVPIDVRSDGVRALLYWVREREAIRVRKEAGEPWPWTRDPILQTYSFCCVRREDDRVTRWIAANIRQPYADHPHLWWMLCAARQLNWPDTLAELIREGAWPDKANFRPEHVTEVLIARQGRREKVFTGAYVIRAESSHEVYWFYWPKVRYVAEIVLGEPWQNRRFFDGYLKQYPTLKGTVDALRNFRGYGPFMAYQCVVDMRFTRLLQYAPDRESWAAAGPGTIRGLNRVAGRSVKSSLQQDKALEEILLLYPQVKEIVPGIDLSDVPNCLCEFDKHQRVKLGEGRPRAKYKPRS